MSPVGEVRGSCPEDGIIELDLWRNEDYVSGSWTKCSEQQEQHGQMIDHFTQTPGKGKHYFTVRTLNVVHTFGSFFSSVITA